MPMSEKLSSHALGHAVAQTHDDDDRRDADDDAQHGQKGAELVAPDVLDGLAEGLKDHAVPLLFCRFKVQRRLDDGLRRAGIAVVDHLAVLQPDDALGLHGNGVVVGDEHHGVALPRAAAAACPAPRGRCGCPARRWARRPE